MEETALLRWLITVVGKLSLGLCLLWGTVVMAQPTPSEPPSLPATPPASAPDNRTEVILQLLKRVESLEAEIKEIKETKPPAAAPLQFANRARQTAGANSQKPATEENKPGDEPTNNNSSADQTANGLPGFQMRGFSNLDWQVNPRNGKSQILLGNVDLLINSRLSEKLSVLAELNIEAESNGEFVIDPERLLLQYAHNNYLNVGVGKYHIGVGYYNTIYHHGKWFETAATRPRIMEFEDKGGILPIHNYGLTVTGQIPSGKLGLNYIAQLGNGGTPHYVRQDLANNPLMVEPRKGKSYLVGLFARPAAVFGLQIGGSVYRDKYERPNAANIWGTILNAHVIWQRPDFELLNEFFWLRHAEVQKGQSWNSWAFYSQISHRFGKSRPYFRYQATNINKNDPFWGDVGHLYGPTFGLRYELSDFAALKLEYERLRNPGHVTINGVTLQIAFTF